MHAMCLLTINYRFLLYVAIEFPTFLHVCVCVRSVEVVHFTMTSILLSTIFDYFQRYSRRNLPIVAFQLHSCFFSSLAESSIDNENKGFVLWLREKWAFHFDTRTFRMKYGCKIMDLIKTFIGTQFETIFTYIPV